MNDAQVCEALKISPRELYRRVDAGKLHPHKRPRPGTKPERVFDPEEVDSLKPAPVAIALRPQEPIPPIPPDSAELAGLPPLTWPAVLDLVQNVVADLGVAAAPETVYMRLKEASEVTGLSYKFLRRLVASGDLEAVKDVAIKVRRDALVDLNVQSALMKPAKKGAKK